MKYRILSTVGLWLGIFAILMFFGMPGVFWVLTIFTLLTQYELYTMLVKMKYSVSVPWGISIGFAMLVIPFYLHEHCSRDLNATYDILALSVIIMSFYIISVGSEQRTKSLNYIMPTLFGVLFIPFMLHYYLKIHQLAIAVNPGAQNESIFLILWLIAVAKFSDVGALLVGKLIGKHKLAPSLSPGKTIEGSLGGLVVSVMIGMLIAALLPGVLSIGKAIIIAIPVALSAMAGDLIESSFKRSAKVKDSGNLIPGIGGSFDLMDSLILSAPIGFICFKYLVY